MPTTILHGETYATALTRRFREEADDMRRREALANQVVTCPMCFSEYVNPLGSLGRLFHYRCVDCGATFSASPSVSAHSAGNEDLSEGW